MSSSSSPRRGNQARHGSARLSSAAGYQDEPPGVQLALLRLMGDACVVRTLRATGQAAFELWSRTRGSCPSFRASALRQGYPTITRSRTQRRFDGHTDKFDCLYAPRVLPSTTAVEEERNEVGNELRQESPHSRVWAPKASHSRSSLLREAENTTEGGVQHAELSTNGGIPASPTFSPPPGHLRAQRCPQFPAPARHKDVDDLPSVLVLPVPPLLGALCCPFQGACSDCPLQGALDLFLIYHTTIAPYCTPKSFIIPGSLAPPHSFSARSPLLPLVPLSSTCPPRSPLGID
ncbi:hypothetical protein B0H14DRAFT_3475370 [Mycena olivaceomarginata]|nr:hypothetical protein B0H14DRAFT_3475370 [Mycena olivaceomarginata]